MERSWYVYMGGTEADHKDVLNYFKLTVKPGCLCGPLLCSIYASGTGPHPISPLSPNMQQYIDQGLLTCEMQPDYPYTAKKYIYLR